MADTSRNIKYAIDKAADKTKSAAEAAGEKGKDMTDKAATAAKKAARSVGDKMKEAGDKIREKVE
jgi:hypothetical protein